MRSLEKLGAAFTGADSKFFDPTRDEMKNAARRVGVPTPNWIFVNRAEDASMYAAALSGAGGHPTYSGLSDEDVANLVAYLSATNFTPTEEDTES